MAIATVAMKNALCATYAAQGTHAALYTSAPSGVNPGTEVTGGTYARVAVSWGSASNGVITGTATINVPSGNTIVGAGVHAGAAGAYLDGGSVTSAQFTSAGTYTLTITYTQS